jgi:hypothetical protein
MSLKIKALASKDDDILDLMEQADLLLSEAKSIDFDIFEFSDKIERKNVLPCLATHLV